MAHHHCWTRCAPAITTRVGRRQSDARRGEHLLERRDDEGQRDGGGGRRDAHDDGRIDERAPQLARQRLALFLIAGQATKDDVERAARFAGAHHVRVHRRECPRVAPHGVGQGVARFHAVHHVAQGVAKTRVLRLPGEHVQAGHQGETRADHRGEEPREQREVAGRHAAPQRRTPAGPPGRRGAVHEATAAARGTAAKREPVPDAEIPEPSGGASPKALRSEGGSGLCFSASRRVARPLK